MELLIKYIWPVVFTVCGLVWSAVFYIAINYCGN